MTNRSTEIPPAARAAADRGEIIEAIKITRQVTSLGLKEAKDAVDAYLHGVTPSGSSADAQIPLQAVLALHQGGLIEAIKRTREATGLGLKESKEAGNTSLFLIGGLVVVAAAVIWWLSRG